ncbi:ABC transporter substrate-binding protein [Paenibacillus sp. GP183]|uniref:ABC transporter substrate-binding protein n=1 Tax=Paenibacillus sp. GP183 TaxID=1882751 RepID=UPI000898FCA4|nr:ABC transporter substrate-binding protein [Paenibacillus sp. GP183]SEB55129.1 ABC-type nitrate/sulfonate/bicarbonate transport system, substrate-binding protein [Paenibacillus sp. GP183]
MKWGKMASVLMMSLTVVVAGCGAKTDNNGNSATATSAATEKPAATAAASTKPAKLTDVKIVLDWTPNTNHTGLYVAKDQGYFEQEGLNVEIIQPGDGGSEGMVAAGKAEFGVSVQESITNARIQGVPIVSIAAIIQHNTSGFASPVSKNIKTPKDFEGKTYGGYGAPVEMAVIESLMQQEKANVSKVKVVNIGSADYFTAVKRDIDFSWIYYAWTGVDAELRNEPINMIYLTKYSDKLDYYTPVLATSEKMIKEKPEIVKAFTAAAAKGYQFAIDKPEEAANMLLKAVPDLDKKLVIASQKWLSPKYKDDAPRWGEQKRAVWDNYATWMLDHKLLEKKLDVDAAFTNDFLPGSKK